MWFSLEQEMQFLQSEWAVQMQIGLNLCFIDYQVFGKVLAWQKRMNFPNNNFFFFFWWELHLSASDAWHENLYDAEMWHWIFPCRKIAFICSLQTVFLQVAGNHFCDQYFPQILIKLFLTLFLTFSVSLLSLTFPTQYKHTLNFKVSKNYSSSSPMKWRKTQTLPPQHILYKMVQIYIATFFFFNFIRYKFDNSC